MMIILVIFHNTFGTVHHELWCDSVDETEHANCCEQAHMVGKIDPLIVKTKKSINN